MRRLGSRLRFLGFLLLASHGGGAVVRAGAGEDPTGTEEAPLAIVTESLPGGRVGRAYEARLEVRGNPGAPPTWRRVSGRLPAGLRLEGGPFATAWGKFRSVGRVEATDGKGGLAEVSGLAVSRRNPGVVWALDDGGNAAQLLALGSDGRLRGRYDLRGVENRDWEDLALGPVRPGHPEKGEVLWVADFGDNGGRRPTIRLVRVREPDVPTNGPPSVALPSESFFFRYPDGPRDAEALLVDWETGTPYVLDKREDGGAAYRVPLPLTRARTVERPATLVRVTEGRPLPPFLTAADAGRDARRIVVRNYVRAWELLRPPDADFEAIFRAEAHVVVAPFLGQYESLALGPRGLTLWTTSERVFGKRPTPLYRVEARESDGAVAGGVAAFLRGTPTRAGTSSFRLEARDSSGARVTRRFELTVRTYGARAIPPH